MPDSPTDFHLSLLAPEFWPLWAGLGSAWSLAHAPYPVQMAVGRRLGRLALRLASARRHIAAVNLRLCFPALSEEERQRLLERHFESLGMGIVETAMSWWTPPNRLRHLGHIEGLENLHHALERGKGVLLLSAHFTSLEIGGRLLARQVPFHVMYRRHKNPLFERVMRKARERNFEKAIDRDDLRGLLRSLRANMPVWYAPDQDHGRHHSVFVDFFGIPAATVTATARLARISGAAVVPFFPERLPGNRGYRLRVLPALEHFPSGDDRHDTLRINRLLEQEIARIPEQYLWVHRRFKTRPEGEPAPY
ncbi:MAG: LpxL/LpxP family Kdo(2)-lipid IV(A) lauroyl/palmitoleoyl acyltransferase [Gammaproteobacteria bacterium]|nr:MAG: LpxL/LpxP family Kdo(2)-lipid IV(A) lauroyl/palmitoleoyl acyltransferase [Gammaproteobacteria bacterium]